VLFVFPSAKIIQVSNRLVKNLFHLMSMWCSFYIWIVLSLIGCEQGKPTGSTLFEERKQLSELTDPRLKEPSGLAASAMNPGLLWTHNDSGNKPEVFLIDEGLNIMLTCRLKGVLNRDWEDITVGPGPKKGKNYVYVGDIGDNLGIFSLKYLYRFEEPVLKQGQTEITITDFDTIVFKLEDGARDTEALLINPVNQNLYVVSKRGAPASVYELSTTNNANDTLVARKITSLPYSGIVAGCFSADGKELLLKNYQHVFYWKIINGGLKKSLEQNPSSLPYSEEPQGEAITFERNGSGYYTLSEKLKDYKTYLYFYKRK
jgi:hypothetical protein